MDNTETSDRLQRCLTWVKDCKRAVSELRGDVKSAISNREKCCMVLSAAMAATLALESLVYSGKVDSIKEQQLQRLCAKVTSTVDLAGARVKVYGQQTRLQKYCKFFRKQHTIDKFDAVIEQLDQHSERAWQLADTYDVPVRRRGMRASFSQGLQKSSISAPADSAVLENTERPDPSWYHTAALTRCRLRRGTRHNGVRCMVFVDPEKSKHAGTQGHVWWYIAGAVGGNLYMHDLGSSSSHELEDARKDPPVSTMHHDPQGYVWLGHKGGLVRVWSDSRLAPVCLPLKCFHAEIKAITSDGQGAAWVGSDAGNVKRIELRSKQVSGGRIVLWLEHVFTLKHQPKSRNSSTQLRSIPSAEMDDLSRADSARASEDSALQEEPAPAVLPGSKAHAGSVTAIQVHRNAVYTSGGSQGAAALHEWTQGGMLHHAHKLRDLGVARAIVIMNALVNVKLPPDMLRQPSCADRLNNVDISSLSSTETVPPQPGAVQPASGAKRNGPQVVTAHDNGQVQVWDMSTGFLQPVLKIGDAGPSARCLVVCKSLGIFATAHADGKLYLRALPDIEAEDSPTVTIGDQPIQTLSHSSVAVIQAHRSGIVSAIGANTGIITCGIFGSVMWWPEAELRSSAEAVDMRLPSEDRTRPHDTGQESPRSSMSKVLRRYFTPSSAALAQATLDRMRSSGDLQGSVKGVDAAELQLSDSVDLDDGAHAHVQLPAADAAAVAPEEAPPQGAAAEAPPAAASEQGSAEADGLKRLTPPGPAAQQFLAEVSRILEEGTARQETNQEMTGKIAHAASVTHLSSLGSQGASGSARSSLNELARSSIESRGPASGPLEVAPSLSQPQYNSAGLSLAGTQHASLLDTQSPFYAANGVAQPSMRPRSQDAAHPIQTPHSSFGSGQQQQQQQQQVIEPALRKSRSVDRSTHTQTEARRSLQRMQRSLSSDAGTDKLANSLPGSLSAEEASSQRPSGSLAESGLVGKNSNSSLSSSIFKEPNQWVIDYSDLTFRKVIGEGSIGRVHLGRWQETDVAIKVLGRFAQPSSMPTAASMQMTGQMSDSVDGDSSEELSDDEGLITEDMALTVKTLEREVSIMSAIRHPNVVLFMGVCLDPPCMVTEFCARGSMFDVLAKARSSPLLAQQLDWPKRISMALDAAKGMLQLHSHKPPILHRDLKSPNLLVDKHWRVKIADFNLSRVMEAQAVVSSISADNPRWLAPEVVTDQNYSTAADVYSFGLILWELLTWQLPWSDLGPFQIMVAIAEKQRRPSIPAECDVPGGSFPGMPAYLKLMKACWDGKPEQRPNFESCIITLRGLLEQATATKSQQKAAGRASSPMRRPGGTSLAEAPRPSAPAPPTQLGSSDPSPHILQSEAHTGPLAQTAQPLGPAVDMQQLQSNLLRPATPTAARLQAAAEGQSEQQGASDPAAEAMTEAHAEHPAPPPEPSHRRRSFQHPDAASVRRSPSLSPPAHIRSQDALLALQGQGSPRLSLHSQRGAARQSLKDDEFCQQQLDQPETAQEQLLLASAPDAGSLLRPGQDLAPGDLDGRGSNHSLHQTAPRHPMHIPKRDAHALTVFDSQDSKLQSLPSRQTLHLGRPKDAINAVHREGSQSSHMSPFAGLAALTFARTSMDERGDHRRGSTGHKPHRMSLEQAVGRDKCIRTVPQRVRVSANAMPRARKSLEDRAPPPASSSGMRNSREACSSETAGQAAARWTDEQRHFEDSRQGQPSGISTTIEESPNPSMSSHPDSDAPGAEHQGPQPAAAAPAAADMPGNDTHASGLSKFSPFASSDLVSVPAFD